MKYLCTLTRMPNNGVVLDPFGGSGTTAVACEQIGRKWIVIEKERDYCEITKCRVSAATEISVSKKRKPIIKPKPSNTLLSWDMINTDVEGR